MSWWFHFHVGGQASEPWEQAPFFTYRARIENWNSTKCDWSSGKPTGQDSDSLLLGPASAQRPRQGLCLFLPVPRVGLACQHLMILLQLSTVQARLIVKRLDWRLLGNNYQCPFPQVANSTSARLRWEVKRLNWEMAQLVMCLLDKLLSLIPRTQGRKASCSSTHLWSQHFGGRDR